MGAHETKVSEQHRSDHREMRSTMPATDTEDSDPGFDLSSASLASFERCQLPGR